MRFRDRVGIDIQPDKELTEEEELLADVVIASQKIPCGLQIGMPMRLDQAIELVDTLFTEKQLPYKDELLGHLRVWKEHAEQALTFSHQCDELMQKVIQSVDSRVKR